MDVEALAGIFGGPIRVVEEIAGFFTRPLLGLWGIIRWLVDTWCEIIVTVLSVFGWLAAIAAFLLMSTGMWLFGVVALIIALSLFAGRESFKLLEFWLSGKGYTIPPAKFVSDIVGTAIGFILLYGILFAIFIFYPAGWLLALILLFASKSVLSSVSRFIRNFLAMIKDQMGGKPSEAKPPAAASGQKPAQKK